jgi:putative DNA primase/helicase
MVDREFRLRNVQRIYPNGHKLFLPHGRTDGLFWPHGAHWQDGSPSAGTLIIGEGYATVAAIHHATGYGVVAALSALNLRAVASTARDLFPTREIMIAADDDSHLPENVGLNAAWQAAQVIGAIVATPDQEAFSGASGVDFADIPRESVAARIAAARMGQ